MPQTSPTAPSDFTDDTMRRAEQYAAHRHEAARQADAAPPAPPSTPWTELLASFMEEKNIRWGELVGGLLIVCSSIALVLSFWSKIADRPLMQFFVFNGVTAGLFGLGYYIDRNWKLNTTSQGLFLIATLLVPLNFLAIAAFAINTSVPTVVTVAGELLSLALLGTLVWAASHITVPRAPRLVLIGVVVTSLTPLLVRRFIDAQTGSLELYLVGLLPTLAYLLPTALFAFRVQRLEKVDEPAVNELFKLLGLISFGAAWPWACRWCATHNPGLRLREFSPLVALCGGAPLVVGLVVWKRLSESALSGLRMAGTAAWPFWEQECRSGPSPWPGLTQSAWRWSRWPTLRCSLPRPPSIACRRLTCWLRPPPPGHTSWSCPSYWEKSPGMSIGPRNSRMPCSMWEAARP